MKKNMTLKTYANRIAKRLMKKGYPGVGVGPMGAGIATIKFTPRYTKPGRNVVVRLFIHTDEQHIRVAVSRSSYLTKWKLYKPRIIVRLVDMLLFNPTPYMP